MTLILGWPSKQQLWARYVGRSSPVSAFTANIAVMSRCCGTGGWLAGWLVGWLVGWID
jgi:hypothetical protein